MKYFKDKKGVVFAYELDGSQDHLIKLGMVEMSEAEIAAHISPPPPTAKEIASAAKLAGVDFEGVMCSATGEDQNGLIAVKVYIEEMGQSRKFRFENENRLLLTPANYAAFMAVWVPFRASFDD